MASVEGVTPTLTYYQGVTPISGAPSAAGSYSVVASFAGSTDYASALSSVAFTISKAAPTVTVSDAGGTADGTTSFSATATVAGVGGQSAAAASLEGVTPTLQYYPGTSATGDDWTTTAPKAPGSYTVLATFPGSADYNIATASTTFTVIPDPYIMATSGSGQTSTVSTPFAEAFTVNVVNTSGQPVSGALVTFTAPASGASGTFAGGLTSVVVATDASGTATAPAFTANGVTGSYNVIASTPGAAVSANFAITNQAALSVSNSVATSGGPSITTGSSGGSTTNDLALQAILNEWSSDASDTPLTSQGNGTVTAGASSVVLYSLASQTSGQQNSPSAGAASSNDAFFASLSSDPDTIVDPDFTG
jgi:hypothetical protein